MWAAAAVAETRHSTVCVSPLDSGDCPFRAGILFGCQREINWWWCVSFATPWMFDSLGTWLLQPAFNGFDSNCVACQRAICILKSAHIFCGTLATVMMMKMTPMIQLMVNGEWWTTMTMSHRRRRFSRLPFINFVGRRIIASKDTWARFNIRTGCGWEGMEGGGGGRCRDSAKKDAALCRFLHTLRIRNVAAEPRIPLVLLPENDQLLCYSVCSCNPHFVLWT